MSGPSSPSRPYSPSTETIRPGRNARIEENALSRTVSFIDRGGWKHPWQATPFWQPKRSQWATIVQAGFVNGVAPIVRTTVGDLKDAQGTFFGQLVDARTGAAESAQLAKLAIGNGSDGGLPLDTLIEVPLYLLPPIQLTFRRLGWDGEASVPKFFQDRGVSKPPVIDPLASIDDLSATAVLTPPDGNRLLRAADIILHQPRIALTSSITLEPGIVTGISNVTQTLSIRSAAPGDRLKVFCSSKFEPLQNFSGATDLLVDSYEEPNFDEIMVATVYLLSPPNTAPGSDPDASWQPYVQHSLFWNLNYSNPPFKSVNTDNAVGSLVSTANLLGGGTASIAINFVAASINDASQAVLNILSAHSLAGSFWTPTGGGTTSKFPDAPAAAVKTGNDKGANARARAKAASDSLKRQKLDPDFPYEGRPFSGG